MQARIGDEGKTDHASPAAGGALQEAFPGPAVGTLRSGIELDTVSKRPLTEQMLIP
jgi:hypothetical protein